VGSLSWNGKLVFLGLPLASSTKQVGALFMPGIVAVHNALCRLCRDNILQKKNVFFFLIVQDLLPSMSRNAYRRNEVLKELVQAPRDKGAGLLPSIMLEHDVGLALLSLQKVKKLLIFLRPIVANKVVI
jgi:hypothetical protein